MARRVKCKLCIGCGKVMPRAATSKGWTITHCGGTRHYYRQCGCMRSRDYHRLVDDLRDAGKDYPYMFWCTGVLTAGVVALPETSQVEGE